MQPSQRPSWPGAQSWAYDEVLHNPACCLESSPISGAHREGGAECRWVQLISCLVAESESPRAYIFRLSSEFSPA
jgi:hypothetical protein